MADDIIEAMRVLGKNFRSVVIEEQAYRKVVLRIDGNRLSFEREFANLKMECVANYSSENRQAVRTLVLALMKGCFEGYENVKKGRVAQATGTAPLLRAIDPTPLFGHLPMAPKNPVKRRTS